jgi:ribosomal protein S18 acetylase RimI-like enzyme
MAPSASLKLRTASFDDAARIAALINLAFSVEKFFIDGERTSENEIQDMIRGGEFLLLETGEGLAAVVYVELRGQRGYFGMLSVDPAWQKLGIGRQLVEIAERRCRNAGCRIMELQTVNLREELPPYYRKLGYVESGTKPFTEKASDRLKMPCHFIQMEKPL